MTTTRSAAMGDYAPLLGRVVQVRREAAHSDLDDLLDSGRDLPPYGQHVEQVRQELEAKVQEPETDP